MTWIKINHFLNAMAAKNKTFWLGGISDNGDQWQWIDGRDIYITAPFWDLNEPNQVENTCMAAETGSVTAHEDVAQSKIFDHNCSDILPFVCQTNSIKCPPDFIQIENFCYLHSKTFGAPNLHWQDARDYCQSLDVYEGYHADLAVLGLQGQNYYNIMDKLIENYNGWVWLGAYRNGTECQYQWVDGRELPLDSIYWGTGNPHCGSQSKVCLHQWETSHRTYLLDDSDYSYPFICQVFQDN
ncbi:unnamed protein product [Meganyctiphanes norvegica]|uniref:C-type lectin domain-containing protein n=1 Tax=Meganyctiphanes norvegica TaxID=48144 RepID=A0AAV2SLM6_MEGNR